jgi:LysM repeat protein
MFCQILRMLHALAMRPIFWLPFSCAAIFNLSGCSNMGGSAGSNPSGTGPFDSQGNYHEEWANDPSKWRKPGSHSQTPAPSDDLPVVTKNEQPPPDASPFTAVEPAKSKDPAAHAPSETTRHTAASKTSSAKHKPSAEKASAHNDDTPSHKPATHKSTSHAATKASAHDDDTPSHKPTTHKSTSHADSEKSQTKPKSTSKTAAKGSRYTVKKGDSLYTIAEHTNSSAAEIRKANGLSGTKLQPGKKLVIPK